MNLDTEACGSPFPPPVLERLTGVLDAPVLPGLASGARSSDHIVSRSQGVAPPVAELEVGSDSLAAPRRLLPLLPLRALLSLALLAIAVGSGSLVLLLTVLRVAPETVGTVDAVIDEYATGSAVVGLSYLAAYVLHCVWSVAQAWNARRTNLLSPPPPTVLLHFVVGPPVVVVGLAIDRWDGVLVVACGIALTFVLWGRSFSVMRVVGQNVDADVRRLSPWGLAWVLHLGIWLLAIPADFLDPAAFVVFTIALLSLQTFVFAAAAVASWIAMGELDRATRARPQIRRAVRGR